MAALAPLPAWSQAAKRLEPVRVDFEKSLTNLLNPETLRKREGRYKYVDRSRLEKMKQNFNLSPLCP
jgi:hypothetical protein